MSKQFFRTKRLYVSNFDSTIQNDFFALPEALAYRRLTYTHAANKLARVCCA